MIMENELCTVIIQFHDGRNSEDLYIPTDISGIDLILALNEAYGLHMNTNDTNHLSIRSENPIRLIKGEKTLSDYGIMNGSIIYV